MSGALLGLAAGSANGAGAYFLIEVYKHVLPQQASRLLFALAIGLAFIFVVQAWLRSAAARQFEKAGLAFLAEFEPAFLAQTARDAAGGVTPQNAMADLIRLFDIAQLLRGRTPLALVELLWAPVFLGILTAVDLRLGLFALAMALLAIGLPFALGRQRPKSRQGVSPERRVLEQALTMPGERDPVELAKRLSVLRQEDRLRESAHRLPAFDLLHTLAMLRELAFIGILTVGATLVLMGAIGVGALMASGILMMRIFVPLQTAISYQAEISAGIAAWKALRAPRPAALP